MSARYAVAVLVLATLALVPTIIHSYAGVVVDDGRKSSSVPATLAGYTSTSSERNATWGKRRFSSDDWLERKYTNGADSIILTVIRSYELTPLYHHPELAVAYHDGHSFGPARTQRFAPRADVPVHVLRAPSPDTAAAMYVLEYDGRFIDDAIAFQLRTSGELLFSGRRAMTLFFAKADEAPPDRELANAGITRILFDAIDAFARRSPDRPPTASR